MSQSSPAFTPLGLRENEAESIDDLIERIRAYNPKVDGEFLKEIFDFSEKAHQGQIRRSGEPYISHPLGVASILADLHMDVATIATGLLHDTVEDTEVKLEVIEQKFGKTVAQLVDGVTKISKMTFRHTHEKQGENVRKMIMAMGKDVRVVLVKLADRLHNMRTLNHMPLEKQGPIAQETLDIYAPLAGRLGISSLKIELEDLGFRYTLPERYYELAQTVAKKKNEREKYIDEVKKILSDELKSKTTTKYNVSGRPKHLYSIYKKMQMRNVGYDQVYDVLAFRVTVDNVGSCYEVLGVVHSLWKPIPGRFKDFIAMPKANNYQSLHTTVIGPDAERIEIQIRTSDMHQIAEWGIAAHWTYKENGRGESTLDAETLKKFNWIRELIALHQNSDSDEFLENIKTDLSDSEIYVFTPKGDVKEFPEGATPIDFAYSIHTDVGSQIVAARVNGKIVSLKYELQNGDNIEIITSKNQKPNKDWIKYCVTGRAKARIRAFVKAEQRSKAMTLGKEIVEKYFRREGHSLQKLFTGPVFEQLLKDSGCATLEELYIRVGYGKLTPQSIIETLVPKAQLEAKKQSEDENNNSSFIARAFKSAALRKKKSASLIHVDGLDDVLVRFAKCCNPIPGDPIVGFITLGRGLTIHRADCDKAFEVDQDRRVDVAWNKSNAQSEAERVVRVRIFCHDIPGLLKAFTEVFTAQGMNIHNAQIRTTRDKKAICLFDVAVRDRIHLANGMEALQKIRGVLGVSRITSV
jgi:guanosine-3',5'-bis(diphosphate) 3'-pyrophosphohydrolase